MDDIEDLIKEIRIVKGTVAKKEEQHGRLYSN